MYDLYLILCAICFAAISLLVHTALDSYRIVLIGVLSADTGGPSGPIARARPPPDRGDACPFAQPGLAHLADPADCAAHHAVTGANDFADSWRQHGGRFLCRSDELWRCGQREQSVEATVRPSAAAGAQQRRTGGQHGHGGQR